MGHPRLIRNHNSLGSSDLHAMSLLGQNVTGNDILALWIHISRHGPVERSVLLRRYYPSDAEDPDESPYRKTLNDAINFLEESNQVDHQEEGYILRDGCLEAAAPRVALLRGLRAQTDENEAYMKVLDVLAEENIRYFDTGNQLNDLLSTNLGTVNWTENKIGYWIRVMSVLGIVAPIGTV